MHINNNLYKLDTPLTQTAGTASYGASKAGTATAGDNGGSIRLSDLSTQIHQLETKLSKEPAFDAARVEEIKAAIRDGSYQVNAEAVADKVIQSIGELFGRQYD